MALSTPVKKFPPHAWHQAQNSCQQSQPIPHKTSYPYIFLSTPLSIVHSIDAILHDRSHVLLHVMFIYPSMNTLLSLPIFIISSVVNLPTFFYAAIDYVFLNILYKGVDLKVTFVWWKDLYKINKIIANMNTSPLKNRANTPNSKSQSKLHSSPSPKKTAHSPSPGPKKTTKLSQ